MNSQLNILAHLAKIDGNIASAEVKFLHHLGQLSGLSDEQIQEALEHPLPIDHLSELSAYEKFECVCHLVQMMKADHEITDPEVMFCRKMAMNLGYDPEVIRAIFNRLDEDPELKSKPDSLFNMVNDYTE